MPESHVLTIVIPALDEEEAIGSTLQRCVDAHAAIQREANVRDVEIIVVSDGADTSTLRVQRFLSNNTPAGVEHVVTNPETTTTSTSTLTTILPGLAIDRNGRVSVAWGARYESKRRWPIDVDSLDATGAPLGKVRGKVLEAGRNSAGPRPAQPDLAFGAAGDLTAAWRSDMGTIRLRRFDATFVDDPNLYDPNDPSVPPPLDVASVDVAFQSRGPRLASAGNSVFLAWAGPVSGVGRVFLQRFDDGAPVLPLPLVLESSSSSAANNPAVAMAGPGFVFVVWEQDGRIVGQQLALDGRALERPRVLSTPAAAGAVQAMPALATTPDGGTAK